MGGGAAIRLNAFAGLAFLRKILPHYARTMPDGYRVTMQPNDSPERILQWAHGFDPATLRFHFVYSAISYGQ
jgi:hypothetical protein